MATFVGFSRLFNYATNSCLRKTSPFSLRGQDFSAPKLWDMLTAGYRTRLPWFEKGTQRSIPLPEYDEEKEKQASAIIQEVNKQITTDTMGRLFAVVHVCGKQFKITESDIIIVQGYWPPNPGDQLKLEKILLVGGKDFTLIGRPVLNRELVSVDATVIEKTLSHTKTRFRMRARKQFKRINFCRVQFTMLRINSININGPVDEKKEVEGLDRIY
ncbi:hypothetical protein KM043_006173 [Ampulex compressa]|nr:hypothetical protein KM043_006173 [Ampulex compressa]